MEKKKVEILNEKHRVKQVILENNLMWKFRCPVCGTWLYIDDDQYNGRVEIRCGCRFYETIDLKQELKK